MVKAGKLRHELTIEENTKAADATGVMVSSWSTFASVYGSIRNTRGSELIQGDSVASNINTFILIRYLQGVRANMRVAATVQGATRYYNIEYINGVLEEDEMIELVCRRLEDITNG